MQTSGNFLNIGLFGKISTVITVLRYRDMPQEKSTASIYRVRQ